MPPLPGQAKQKEQKKGSHLKDLLSCYIASCCEINGLYSTRECVMQLCPRYRWCLGVRAH